MIYTVVNMAPLFISASKSALSLNNLKAHSYDKSYEFV